MVVCGIVKPNGVYIDRLNGMEEARAIYTELSTACSNMEMRKSN